ncbi:helix-turn-helix transcriptional regulator [Methylobacterium symbioticum]|uniref:HTH cro/C1-type domain-containing protein n=1 Tax=Methylobacterium symbioticum TaxID=2584084 RepID=A0A509EES5_9HYPH|nr:hypothetical protein MET9862_03240 [Methylobacterium symbioticum]
MTIVRTRTPSGEAIVILPEAEFERLRELAEDALDAKLVDESAARLEAGADELLSEADLDALRAAPSPLAFWRERRGLTVAALAKAGGVPEARIATLERNEATAEPALYERLAGALDVDVEDIRPEAA